MKEKVKSIAIGGSAMILVLVVWQLASVTGIFGKYDIRKGSVLLPSPIFVFQRMIELISNGYLIENIWISFQRVIIGFLIAAVIGLPVGILMARKTEINDFFQPLLHILAPIPGVAWVPLAILWFGLGNDAAIFIIIVSTIIPIVVNTEQGVKSVDKKLEDVLFMFEASRIQVLRYLIIPSVIPYVLSGFKLGLGYAWRVVIAAEMVGVPKGIGYVLNAGRSTAQTEITFISIISLCLIMVFMEKCLFYPFERMTKGWTVNE